MICQNSVKLVFLTYYALKKSSGNSFRKTDVLTMVKQVF